MISGRTNNFLALAGAAATNSRYRYRLGAVIVAGGRVRGVGWSKRRNTPRNVSEDHLEHCSIHAEQDALRGLVGLKRAACYVARLDAQERPVLAMPCERCWEILVKSGVTKIYWTTGSDTIGYGTVLDAQL